MPERGIGSDDDLIARIAGGDREAFAALYREYRPDVYRFALHMCGSPALAEDVVQDVFVAVIKAAARYQPDRSTVVSWLLGIASNHVKRWRHRRRLVALPEDESDDGRKIAVRDNPLADIARQRQEAALSRALLGLPAKYRAAIVLCDLQQLSYEDAARTLGCAVGTVRSRLHRGRARLARMLRRTSGDLMCGTPAAKLL